MTDQREGMKLVLSATVMVLIYLVHVSSADVSCANPTDDRKIPLPDDSDFFRVWFRFLIPNGIQVKMSARTAEELHKYYLEHTYQQNQDYMLSLFKAMRQWDQTGFEGEITDEDHVYATTVIHQGFRHFHDKVMQLKTRGCGVSIYLQTQRTKHWDEDNANEIISFTNKFDDDHDCCHS